MGKGRPEASALTSARHGSKGPALAILDWLAPKVLPPLENIHTPNPGHGAHPILIAVVPPPKQHPLVLVITVYLWQEKRGGMEGQEQAEEGEREPLPHSHALSPTLASSIHARARWDASGHGAN